MSPDLRFGGASASTSALIPTEDPRFHEIIRPTSAGPRSPSFQLPSLDIAQPPHRVLDGMDSASVDPVLLDLVPYLVVSPPQDSLIMAASTTVKVNPNEAQLPARVAQVVGTVTSDPNVFLSPHKVHKSMADTI